MAWITLVQSSLLVSSPSPSAHLQLFQTDFFLLKITSGCLSRESDGSIGPIHPDADPLELIPLIANLPAAYHRGPRPWSERNAFGFCHWSQTCARVLKQTKFSKSGRLPVGG